MAQPLNYTNLKLLLFLLFSASVRFVLSTDDGATLQYLHNNDWNTDKFPGSDTWQDSTGSNDVNPCDGWAHVRCNDNNQIVGLDLSNLGISSPDFNRFFLLFPALQSLSIRGNKFQGPLPLNIRVLTNLTYLDLSDNLLTGTIPSDFDHMNLTYLNLSSNGFTGTISATLRSKFCYQYFENNPSLTPSKPSSFISCALATFVNAPPPPAIIVTSSSKLGLILGVSLGGAFLILILLLLGLLLCFRSYFAEKPKKLTPEELEEIEAGLDQLSLAHVKRFTMEELATVTSDWAEIIGSGGTAIVYKGMADINGSLKPVAVKRLKSTTASKDSLMQFCNEIDIISRAVHRNVTKLEGFCISAEERVLVFPYFHFGSVQDHLRGQKFHHNKPISLESRKNIAIGAARGMSYLHEECSVKIIHRDIKAANVLLDSELEAVVTDFGLAQLLGIHEKESGPASKIAGTFGHIAPEYLISGRITEKIDVYAFGVFLLEILTGMHAGNLHELCGTSRTLKEWLLSSLASGDLASYLDIELRAKFLTLDEDGNYILDDIFPICHVASLCLSSDPDGRPPMSHVVRMLQGEENLADARSKISEEVPESVVSWNAGYGPFESLSQSLMSFMSEDTNSNVDINSRIDLESRLR